MKTLVERDEFYRKLLKGVYEKRQEFDASIWADRFVEYCREVFFASGRRGSGRKRTTHSGLYDANMTGPPAFSEAKKSSGTDGKSQMV
jgi:hypothetical protein